MGDQTQGQLAGPSHASVLCKPLETNLDHSSFTVQVTLMTRHPSLPFPSLAVCFLLHKHFPSLPRSTLNSSYYLFCALGLLPTLLCVFSKIPGTPGRDGVWWQDLRIFC